MITKETKEAISRLVPESHVLYDEPLKKHTTFQVGGNSDCLIFVEKEKELKDLIKYLDGAGIPRYLIGNGSNLLVSDDGFRGVILETRRLFSDIKVEGETIIAKAGALMSKIGSVALENELTGFEFAAGIPGTIGGGVVMNAGAYGGELKDVIVSVRVLTKDGKSEEISCEDMGFGYRTSVVRKNEYIVTEVKIKLSKGNKEEIKATMEDLKERRKSKQPLEYPSAGSTFKRPEGYFAGKLIEDAGLRGYSVGGAMVSEKHCGFIINKGDASASDVDKLIKDVSKRVKDSFGVTLEPEVIRLGKF
ncbi:UDP-N-acetylmuramate dehydrogenase [Lachnospiraceae bacterium G11]|nr:UDP-N-acetylmuramate dehydrogenase [Lachnospiraceae bacterium G11]